MVNLKINNLTKVYNDKTVLNNISFEVNDGEFLSILGPSGCGKTTLLKILIGIESPTSGEIIKNEKDITNLDPSKRGMGIVFQNYALFPNMNVLDNVMYALNLKLKNKDKAKKEAMKVLNVVNMDEHINKYPHELSGGQQQRVAIARTLSLKPDIILFDEPMSALDADNRLILRKELKALQKEFKTTMIYITHDQEEAINMSDRIAVMKDGRIEQIGTPDEIYNHPKTSYVATFVGNANILHGAAESIQGQNAIVKIGNDKVIVKLETSQQNTEDTGGKQHLAAGEKVTLAVRSENILLQEAAVIGNTGTDNGDTVDISVAGGISDIHDANSISGLQATVTEKNFAGGQLRVTLKLSDGTQLIASRYGIDASVAEGQTVRCSFLPTDAVLVDREDIHEEA